MNKKTKINQHKTNTGAAPQNGETIQESNDNTLQESNESILQESNEGKKKNGGVFASIREWKNRNNTIVTKFCVTFTATVLGIIITFGTNRIYERHKKEAEANALVERCLNDMEGRLKSINRVVGFYDKHDSLYYQVENNPLETLDDVMLGSLVYEFTMAYNLIVNHAYEKSFSQSVTSHDILGQYAEVIGAGFEYLLYAEENHEQINQLQIELLRRQMLACNTVYDNKSVKEVVAATLADPYFKFYQDQYKVHSASVRHMQYVLEFYIKEARRLWKKEITFEEFGQSIDNRWMEWNKQKANVGM